MEETPARVVVTLSSAGAGGEGGSDRAGGAGAGVAAVASLAVAARQGQPDLAQPTVVGVHLVATAATRLSTRACLALVAQTTVTSDGSWKGAVAGLVAVVATISAAGAEVAA